MSGFFYGRFCPLTKRELCFLEACFCVCSMICSVRMRPVLCVLAHPVDHLAPRRHRLEGRRHRLAVRRVRLGPSD
jgi:hypothetical protein